MWENSIRHWLLRMVRACIIWVIMSVPFLRCLLVSKLVGDDVHYGLASLAAPALITKTR
jgi:hypothetical protein